MRTLLLASFLIAINAYAVEEFNVEVPLSNRASIPAVVIDDLSNDIDLKGSGCSESSIAEVIEATSVRVSSTHKELLVKPTAWCLCGAYYCPIWIYQLSGRKAKRLWSTRGTSNVEILVTKQKGYHHIRESGGTAGHSYFQIWEWDGARYRVSRKKFMSAVTANPPLQRDACAGKPASRP
jgi:hypothetical protein